VWLRALARLAERVAHEVKNPLNGVAVNVEVVRGRAARGDSDPTSLLPFAEAAAGELQHVAELVDALLALARPVPEPVDLWGTLHALIRLYAAVATADGGELSVERPTAPLPPVAAPSTAVRAALATALDALVSGGARVHARVVSSPDRLAVELHGSRPPVAVPEPACTTIAAHGVLLHPAPNGITLLFAARRDALDAT
jgi:signal transduction histidine kinase